MKKIIIVVSVITACFYIACKKNIPIENGTIDGLPAITLYGSSNAPTDYLFISTSQKKISYNGNIFNYNYGPGKTIFCYSNYSPAATASLDTSVPRMTLTIDTSYGFTFLSTIYTAK